MSVSLCNESQRETFSEVTAGFNDEFTPSPELVLLNLTVSNDSLTPSRKTSIEMPFKMNSI